MKITEFKSTLEGLQNLSFVQPNGAPVPAHFHITEAGLTTRHFIDCGGVERIEQRVVFQLWVADDTEHRLQSSKLLSIINKAEHLWSGQNPEVEAEYQGLTIGRFGIVVDYGMFMLVPKQTDCLAMDKCGIPEVKQKVKLSELGNAGSSCCTPGGTCC